MTPFDVTKLSVSLKAAGMFHSPNKRLPVPSVIGKVMRHSSSTRSFLNSVWARVPLPWTLIVEPSEFLSFLTSSTFLSKIEVFQYDLVVSDSSIVVLTAYFVVALMHGRF